MLNDGEVPIFEPGLAELVERNTAAGRLFFTTDIAKAVSEAGIIYLAVGTPQRNDGSADLNSLWEVAESIAPHLRPDAIVVVKSTVPVGTNAQLYARLNELTGRECDVASNPEFLKEGAAIEDFNKPDRVVVGVRRQEVADVLHRLYAPFLRTDNPFLVMSPESSELTKYVANGLLGYEDQLHQPNGQSVRALSRRHQRRAAGHRPRSTHRLRFPVSRGRLRRQLLSQGRAGPGQHLSRGGHRAEAAGGGRLGEPATEGVVADEVRAALRRRSCRASGWPIWGLSFKPKTDDIREAPALVLIDALLERNCEVIVHDPEAMDNVRRLYGDQIEYAEQPMDVLTNADALVIMTEWTEFRNPDFAAIRSAMRGDVIFDGRNLYDPADVTAAGFTYHSIGRPVARPK